MRPWIFLLSVEVVAFALIAVGTARFFTLTDSLAVVLSMLVAYAIPRMCFKRQKTRSTAGDVVLMVVGLLLVAYAVHCIWSFTLKEGATLDLPRLYSDDRQYFNWALARYNGSGEVPAVNFWGFPFLVFCLWKLLGVNIVWPIAMNVMFTLLSIVITGQLAARLLKGRIELSGQSIATLSMMLTSLLAYYISQGANLQKEAVTYLALMMVAFAMVRCCNHAQSEYKKRWDLILFAMGCLLLAACRTTMGYFVLGGVVIMTLSDWRKNRRYGTLLACLAMLIFGIGFMLVPDYGITRQMSILEGGKAMQMKFIVGPSQTPYFNIIGNYFYYPMWKRLALLPMTSAVQYIIPFPWLYEGCGSVQNALPRIAWPWYAIGGIALYYYVFISWRKGVGLGAWALWPALCFLAVAYVTGGSVNRYILPFQPFFVIIAVFVIGKLREGKGRRSFVAFIVGYTMILIAVLVVCYHMQTSYLNSLEMYYRSMMQ